MPHFATQKRESGTTRRFRWMMNLWPVYRGTGAWVNFIAADWHEIQIRLPLNILTRNYVGTQYGGSLYSAADPFFMLMFLKILGPDYIVWDQSASIRFLKPGKSTLYAHFLLTPHQVAEAKHQADHQRSLRITLPVQWVDRQGTVHAELQKEIYIRRKTPRPGSEPPGRAE